jgi:energy-converting hydrogenase Eha subunit G
MTPEHLLFIPAIFLIGFAAGSMLTPYTIALSQKRQLGQHTTERQKAQLNRVSGRTVLCTLLGFVVVFAATHLFSLPNTMASLGEMTGGLPLFDQRASF